MRWAVTDSPPGGPEPRRKTRWPSLRSGGRGHRIRHRGRSSDHRQPHLLLAATICTRDVSQAHTMARWIRAGAMWGNGWAAIDPALAWGGVIASGIGRRLGWSGILANTEEKVATTVL
jgi:aldehyde dehydrogenase family protein